MRKATTAQKRCEAKCDLHVWIPLRLVSVLWNVAIMLEINYVIREMEEIVAKVIVSKVDLKVIGPIRVQMRLLFVLTVVLVFLTKAATIEILDLVMISDQIADKSPIL